MCKNGCKDNANTFSYTTDLDYVTLETKWMVAWGTTLVDGYRTIVTCKCTSMFNAQSNNNVICNNSKGYMFYHQSYAIIRPLQQNVSRTIIAQLLIHVFE
jgi:hypothetical protein